MPESNRISTRRARFLDALLSSEPYPSVLLDGHPLDCPPIVASLRCKIFQMDVPYTLPELVYLHHILSSYIAAPPSDYHPRIASALLRDVRDALSPYVCFPVEDSIADKS